MFTKATKQGSKLRAACFGPSGAGKTYTSLRIATGLVGPNGRIAVIDTECGSACLYADKFNFDVCELNDRTVDGYIKAMAYAAGYDALIIDSITHCWDELKAEKDRLQNTSRFGKNDWAAWSVITPKHKAFIDAITRHPSHIFATMRSKTEWQVGNSGGKTKPIRVGLTPEQRSGMEFEFSLLIEIGQDHTAEIIKDRTGKFQDQIIEKPGEEFGQQLAAWLSDFAPKVYQPTIPPRPGCISPAELPVTRY